MAGDSSDVIARNDAWITVLATSEKEEVQLNEVDEVLPPELAAAPRASRMWGLASLAVLGTGLAGTLAATYVAIDRFLPELADVRGPDGDPPAVFVQSDDSSGVVADYGGRAAEWASSWPIVLIAPLLLATLVGLLAGWIRWRMGRARAAEKRARRLENESVRLTAHATQQAMQLDAMDYEVTSAKSQVIDLTDRLEDQSERVDTDAVVGQRLLDDLEAKTREAGRLAADLEDALIERDNLEATVNTLKGELHALVNRTAESEQMRSDSADAAEQLADAADLIRQQRRKIESLENHLDQVRRRTAEMAQEARSAQQLRGAWAQAEEVIADLSHQLSEAEEGRSSFGPQTAEAIVADNSRVFELEALLNDAADVIESVQEQLRQTRFQLSERDAALARSDVRNEALRTEVGLLNEEIDQAAYALATLQELPRQQQQTQSMLDDLRDALNAERSRAAELERQLRVVSARSLRLEGRLLGGRQGDRVLDLTDPGAASAAVDESPAASTPAA